MIAARIVRLAGSLTEPVARVIAGDDIFISYARRDGAEYAESLGRSLTQQGFSCWLDRWESWPGLQLPSRLRRRLVRSSMLVVVGTEGSNVSESIEIEIAEFCRANEHRNRSVFVIDIADSLKHARWARLVAGVPAASDSGATRAPTEEIVARVVASITFTRRNRRLQRTATVTATLIATMVLLGTIAGVALNNRARRDEERARQASTRADAAQREQKRLEGRAAEAAQSLDRITRRADDETARAGQAERDRSAAEALAAAARDEARVRALVEASAGVATSSPDRALLLAAEAVNAVRSNSGAVVHEARDNFWALLARYSRLQYSLYGLDTGATGLVNEAAPSALFASDGTQLRVWDLKNRKSSAPILALDKESRLDSLWGLDVTGGGQYAALFRAFGEILFVDLAHKTHIGVNMQATAGVPPFGVRSLAFDKSGHWLAVGSCSSLGDADEPWRCKNNLVVVLDASTGKMEKRLVRSNAVFTEAVAFLDSQRLVAAGGDGQLALWNWPAEELHPRGPRCEDKSEARSLDVKEDGTQVAAGCSNGQVLIWQIADDTTLQFKVDGPVLSTAFLPRHDAVAVGDETGLITIVDLAAGVPQTRIQVGGQPAHLAFDESGDTMFVAHKDDGRIDAWSTGAASRVAVELYAGSGQSNVASVSASGRYVAIGLRNGTIVLAEATTGKRRLIRGDVRQLGSLAFNQTEDILAAGACGKTSFNGKLCEEGEVHLWGLNSEFERKVPVHSDQVRLLYFLPDGRLLSGTKNEMALWNPQADPGDGYEVQLNEDVDVHMALAVSRTQLLLSGYTGKVALVGLDPLQDRQQLFDAGYPINAWALSPGSNTIVTATSAGTVRWDRSAAGFRKSLIWPTTASALAFTEGRRELLAELGEGRFVRWDMATQRVVAEYRVPSAYTVAAFFPQPDRLLTWGERTASVWKLNERERDPRIACELANRRLRPDERNLFLGGAERSAFCDTNRSDGQ